MNETTPAIRPRTLALDALIQETIRQTEASAASAPADTMVFLGNRHQSFPTSVVIDPVLEPVDKLVWMVIMLAVPETGGNTAFPGYDAIGKMATVSSRSTIARAIAILRATRWLTLCARVRRASGRFRGNIYALHDEPLPLADALHLDANYMAFLRKMLDHGHARVRAVAQGVLDSTNEDIQAGQDISIQAHPIERRLQSVVATKGGESRRFFSFTRAVVRRLRSDLTNDKKGGIHHDQNSNTDGRRVRNSNSGSSSYINKNTTTTNNSGSTKFVLTGEDDKPLIYPARLCDNHREVASCYLRALAPEQRQPILDELEGRFRAEQKGMKPVYDELSFLCSLCKRMKQGKFRSNLGIKVSQGRHKQTQALRNTGETAAIQPAEESDEQREKRRAACQENIAEMRRLLGMMPPAKKQPVTSGA
jgi:hypothetical protein